MALLSSSSIILPKRSRFAIPKRIVLSTVIALLCLAVLLVTKTAHDEKERMLHTMKNQADILIWALEGATRSMAPNHSSMDPLHTLLEEVAKQPNIAYLAIVDTNGLIVNHSDPSIQGRNALDPETLAIVSQQTTSYGRFAHTQDGIVIYEVIKPFTPSVSRGHRMRGQHMRRMEQDSRFQNAHNESTRAPSYYIIVGVDPEQCEDTYKASVRSAAILSLLLIACGVTGLTLFFFIRNYKASARQLRDAHLFTEQVFENLPIGVLTTDTHGTITLYNKHIANTFTLSQTGKTVPTLGDYPVLDWQALMQELQRGAPILEREMTFGTPGSTGIPVSLSATLITTSDDEASGYLFILRNLEEVKKLQSQIRLNERLSALGNMAAGVAHEIRNPLSTIKGYATYLAGKFTQGEKAYATSHMMILEVERLNRVVSDLLNVARIGAITPKKEALLPVLEHALRLAEPEATAHGVQLLSPEGQDIATLSALIDADKFVQALLNLLINAIQASTESQGPEKATGKAAEKSIVQLGVSVPSVPAGEAPVIRVSVSDTGPGMTDDVITSLFTPYFTTKASGTGLGLTIVHQIIEQHGGSITVNSLPGQGSVFTITLPLCA